MLLPQLFLLNTGEDWIVTKSGFVSPNVYKFDFFEDAKKVLKGAQVHRQKDKRKKYVVDWKCTEKNKVLEHEFIYQGVQVKTIEYDTLPVLYSYHWTWYFPKDMTYLDTAILRVRAPLSIPAPDESQEFPWGVPYKVCVPVRVPVTETVVQTVYVKTPSESQKLPRHLVSMVLDAAVSKGETCPITMEAFTKDSIVMTPCGHFFQREAIERSLSCKPECPQCRGLVQKEELVGY